jgi:spore maturation protein A
MRIIGKFVRYVLNINTIWGWMILIALALAAYQQYTPTETPLPASALRDGENALAIRLIARDGETREYSYVLTNARGANAEMDGLRIADADRRPGGERPWLISAARTNDGYMLTWDAAAYGRYELLANGSPVDRGRLVTLQALTDAAFEYAKIGFELALGLVASMVLFLGLMKVGEAAGLVQLVARAFHPVIRFLFPDVPKDHPAIGAIVMNWTTTLLGLGNAATPFGLKAMQELQKLNPHKNVASNAQVMLLGYNTAGLALLPTTLIAMRKAAGCSNPFEIIGTCFVAGLVATVTAIAMVKVLGALPFFSVRAAVEEEAREAAGNASKSAGTARGEGA